MSAIAKEILTTADLDQLKVRLKSTWMTGDYDVFARFMEKDAEVLPAAWNHAGNPAAGRGLRRRTACPDCGPRGSGGDRL